MCTTLIIDDRFADRLLSLSLVHYSQSELARGGLHRQPKSWAVRTLATWPRLTAVRSSKDVMGSIEKQIVDDMVLYSSALWVHVLTGLRIARVLFLSLDPLAFAGSRSE